MKHENGWHLHFLENNDFSWECMKHLFLKKIDDHLLQIFMNVECDICIIWIENDFFSLKKWWKMRTIVAFFKNNLC
jgi:hypothetical protein